MLVMTIRNFDKWLSREYGEDSDWDEGWTKSDMQNAFDAGVKTASDHFELEKIQIHEYYKINDKEEDGTSLI